MYLSIHYLYTKYLPLLSPRPQPEREAVEPTGKISRTWVVFILGSFGGEVLNLVPRPLLLLAPYLTQYLKLSLRAGQGNLTT